MIMNSSVAVEAGVQDLMDYFLDEENHALENVKKHIFKKDEYIFLPEEKALYVCLIRAGRVKIGVQSHDGRFIIKSILKEGDLFGELALFGDTFRKEFAQSMDADTEIIMVPLESIEKKMKEDRVFCNEITQVIGKKLLRAQRRLESFVFKDAQSRIIQFLTDLVKEDGKRIGYEMLVPRFYTHQEIAHLTNTSRQTVTTVLSKLKTKNLIFIRRKKLLVRDLDELERLIA